jgi:hypothetical protein
MSASSQHFRASPLDRPTRLMTLGVGLLLALLIPLLAGGEDEVGRAALVAIGLGLLIASFGFAPRRYELTGATLIVRRRLFGSVRFRLVDTPGVLPWSVGFGTFRLLGSGGLFGWYGLFHKPGIGRLRAYLTDRFRPVGCPTDRGLVIVSPADPDAFVAAASAAVSSSDPRT